jgi:hypothetical protein
MTHVAFNGPPQGARLNGALTPQRAASHPEMNSRNV